MFFSAAFVGVLSLLSPVLAAPTRISSKAFGCPISDARPNLTGTTLSVPSGTPVFIALGVGVQNYTCDSTGTFASTGAVVKMFDISCLVKTSLFDCVQDEVFDMAATDQGDALVKKIESITKIYPVFLGDHYFITNPATNGTDITPIFDFRAGLKKGDPTGFAALTEIASSASPAGPANVDWLSLQNIGGAIGGSLATSIMRINTKSGQPPTSCKANASITVPFTTKYWMFK